MKKIIFYSVGAINVMLGVFHIFFWKLFNWAEELSKISRENRGILQIANIILIFIIFYFAVMSFIMAKHRKIDIYAKSILICASGFYLIRLVTGYMFFGSSIAELIISIICALVIIGYIFVLLGSARNARA